MQPTDWIGAIGGVAGVLVGVGALVLASRANLRSYEANQIAQRALDRETEIDERQREFRAVEWNTRIFADEDSDELFFELTNTGETDARAVTLVLVLSPEREVRKLGGIPARGSVLVTSDCFVGWTREAWRHEVFQPEAHIHWSSPLGAASTKTIPSKTVHDFIVWDQEDY